MSQVQDGHRTLDFGEVLEVASDPDALAAEIGMPVEKWAHQGHQVSYKLLRTGRFGYGRIARGWCEGVTSQHSWIHLSKDVYDNGIRVDPTLWSYDPSVTQTIWVTLGQPRYHPHGAGSIWRHTMPPEAREEPIRLHGQHQLPESAEAFLEVVDANVGPLDRRGWAHLANGPMEGWPARPIIEAMLDTPKLAALVPIDIAGMLTDRNPLGVYLMDGPEWKEDPEGRPR